MKHKQGRIQGRILIVGAGIGGIRSALDLAESGYPVTLIDHLPHLGGLVSQLDRQFPTHGCGMCRMLPMLERNPWDQICLRKGLFHPDIELLLATEITGLSGDPGHFTVGLKQAPQWIASDLCVGCGACQSVCPVHVPDAFNAGLSERTAIYRPIPHATSTPYLIDTTACTRCGACAAACPTGAIALPTGQRHDFKLLVVDDEYAVRDSLKEWLVSEDYGWVETAESGAQALEMLAHSPFQVMLADIKMPGMDGVELLQQAKLAQPDLTVVMMTAYATVETAVQAMRQGALDYLVKPFDPDKVIALIDTIYHSLEARCDRQIEVGALIVSTGADYFDPSSGKNPYAYGISPYVVTQLQFERLLSGTGPGMGRLIRPGDGKPLEKIAWLQCVGSRDLELQADFCSAICCMISIKEALWARDISGGRLAATLFHMDMRTCGKTHQVYRDQAERQKIHFERARVHSVTFDPSTGDPVLRYVGRDGAVVQSAFDMVVLAVGQRPAATTQTLAERIDIQRHASGFFQDRPFIPTASTREGIFLGGSASGFKEIGLSVIQASAAAVQAARLIHHTGGTLKTAPEPPALSDALVRETPRIRVVVCTCQDKLCAVDGRTELARDLEQNPTVGGVTFIDRLCGATGWQELEQQAPLGNALLVGACDQHLLLPKLQHLAAAIGLPQTLVDLVDLQPARWVGAPGAACTNSSVRALRIGLARLSHANPDPWPTAPVCRRALVIGGGIAGMHAALAIADMGYPVDLIESGSRLGGQLHWLHHTIEGHEVAPFLNQTCSAVTDHPRISLTLNARWHHADGHVGRFLTWIENQAGELKIIEHGVTILAAGGSEAVADTSGKEYGFGSHERIITQKMFETQLSEERLEPNKLNSVVMIQCAGSRQPPRNYCSRVCCATSLKHALYLKQHHPQIQVWVLYRDIMTPGPNEACYTQARQAGVIFIPYEPQGKPQITSADNDELRVTAVDPILGATLKIAADLVILAVGVTGGLPAAMAAAYHTELDEHGFFQEADPKWRPVQGLAEGVLACGLCLGPQTIGEAVTSGQAAAQGALRVLTREVVHSGHPTASVRHGLCSLCQQCIGACAYGARWVDLDLGQVVVHPALCQGCGACAAACPNGAAVLNGHSAVQMLAAIDATLA